MNKDINTDIPFPEKPIFSDELWATCRNSKDFIPILFEWYRYVGVVCNITASLSFSSLAIREMPSIYYSILSGLLNRCSRIMLSVMRLAVTKKYGETIVLLDRSIYESAVIVQWLCKKNSDDCFKQYLAGGLKSDLKLKDHIQENIQKRGGVRLVIEKDMLNSIQEYVKSTGLSEEQIRQTKSLPDLWSMCSSIGLSETFYIGTQRMGSHEVHGTWTALRGFYLKQNANGEYSLRDHDVRPHENQFMTIPIVILDTLSKFIEYVIPDPVHQEPFRMNFDDSKKELLKLSKEIIASDFETVSE